MERLRIAGCPTNRDQAKQSACQLFRGATPQDGAAQHGVSVGNRESTPERGPESPSLGRSGGGPRIGAGSRAQKNRRLGAGFGVPRAAAQRPLRSSISFTASATCSSLSEASPPRGGDASLSDEQVAEAVKLMLERSGL